MARLFLDLFGWSLHVQTGRTDDEPEEEADDEEPEEPPIQAYGGVDSTPIGFAPNSPAPYEVDFPDHGAWSDRL